MKWAIDVSEYDVKEWVVNAYHPNGAWLYDLPMNWKTSGLDMAIVKCSEGLSYKDPGFDLNWSGAKSASLPRAAYHFFRSNQNAIQQQNFAHQVLKDDFTDKDFLVIDFETPDGQTPAACLANLGSFINEAEKWLPSDRIGIYTYPAFWRQVCPTNTVWPAKYRLFEAQWPEDIWVLGFPINIFDATKLANLKSDVAAGRITPMLMAPWNRTPDVWQFTSRADTKAIPGHPAIKKVADYDAIFMDLPDTSAPVIPLTCPFCGHEMPAGWSYKP